MNTYVGLQWLKAVALTVSLTTLATVSVASPVEDGIAERIKPVGSVCVKGDSCAANLTLASAGPMAAEDVYNKFCLACHASGAAGAPKFRNADDWSSRIASGIESLYSNSINGKGAMPAKGLCMSCSDDDIKATVDYMIEGI